MFLIQKTTKLKREGLTRFIPGGGGISISSEAPVEVFQHQRKLLFTVFGIRTLLIN
jgi:hypothetical protein